MADPDAAPHSGPTTEIILVRHGHVPGIAPPRFRGRIDLPLTALGERQAAATRDRLLALARPDVAYASPLSRCMRTAAVIAAPHGLPVTPLPDFIDIDYGAWQGRSFEEVRASAPAAFAVWLDTPDRAVIPGGEALADVAARVADVLRLLPSRHAGGTIVLVGHDVVNRVALLLALGLKLSRFWRLGQDPCAVNRLTFAESTGWTVQSINETSHLAGVD